MEKTNRSARLLRLFGSTLVISACTFGGGFVIVSLMKKKFVDEYGWLSEAEMLDYTALAQSCPGDSIACLHGEVNLFFPVSR